MKISELLLLALLEAGGRTEYLQLEKWRNELLKAELLDVEWDRSTGTLQHYLVLTDKGRTAAERARTKING